MNRWRRMGSALFAALAMACGTATPVQAPAPVQVGTLTPDVPRAPLVFPAEAWQRIEVPETAGYRRGGLDSLTAYLRTLTTTGLMVLAAHCPGSCPVP